MRPTPDRDAAAPLPEPIPALIGALVRRTRLRRRERAEVAQEITAHFADGLAAGVPAATLVERFGDVAKAAKLIRRAKIRNRPLLWHVRHRAAQALGVLAVLYVAAWAWLVLDRPNPTVDYLAKLNAPAAAVAPEERAWPLYREAIVRFNVLQLSLEDLEAGTADGTQRLPRPGEPGWDRVAAFLDAHAELLTLCRQASQRAGMGLQVGFAYDFAAEDAQALAVQSAAAPPLGEDRLRQRPLLGVLLPHLSPMRTLARVVALDLGAAAAVGDGPRVLADLRTLWAMARHVDEAPFLINGLVGAAVRSLALQALGDALEQRPDALTDEQWRDVAHRLADLPQRLPQQGERWAWDDAMQRFYGRHGRFSAEGLRYLRAAADGDAPSWNARALQSASLPLTAVAIAPRHAMQAEYERLMALVDARAELPLWRLLREPSEVERVLAADYSSLTMRIRFLPIALLLPGLDRVHPTRAVLTAQRDALQAAIAVELFRRAQGRYPVSWSELVPGLLPREPVDHSTGRPLLFRVVEGRPILYGRGLDDDDDGGRMSEAALRRWPKPVEDAGEDTDWVLWPPVVRPVVAPAAP